MIRKKNHVTVNNPTNNNKDNSGQQHDMTTTTITNNNNSNHNNNDNDNDINTTVTSNSTSKCNNSMNEATTIVLTEKTTATNTAAATITIPSSTTIAKTSSIITTTSAWKRLTSLLSLLLLPKQNRNHRAVLILILFAIVMIISLLLQQQQQQQKWQRQEQLRKYQYEQLLQSIITDTNSSSSHQQQKVDHHTVANLYCHSYGGPYDTVSTNEMVYWKDIPSDTLYEPIHWNNNDNDNDEEDNDHDNNNNINVEQYITLEPDEGGWNNIRMSLETAIAISIYTSRTLVLPPSMTLYLLWNNKKNSTQNILSFYDFFHINSIQYEYNNITNINNNNTNNTKDIRKRKRPLFKVISFDDFLENVVMKQGIIIDPITNKTSFPPNNWTKEWHNNKNALLKNYESTNSKYGNLLWNWLRNVTQPLQWDSEKCVAIIPHIFNNQTVIDNIIYGFEQLKQSKTIKPHFREYRKRIRKYNGNPTPVYANYTLRLLELLSHRTEICIYDILYQNAPIIHLMGNGQSGYRMLQHYYTFFIHENYHTDLWVKRFIRDHLRYIDQVQCCAARIIKQLKILSMKHYNNDNNIINNYGTYDAFHIRRGDFQYKDQRLTAEEMYENHIKYIIPTNSTIYISTDEKDYKFFKILHQYYHVYYLNDFINEINLDPTIVNPNYYGMIEQLICSKSYTFTGTYYSTFTGYINRLRGYHIQNEHQKQLIQLRSTINNTNEITTTNIMIDKIQYEYNQGIINSYYNVPDHMKKKRTIMKEQYHSIEPPFWSQEWHIGWRDIDYDVDV